MNHARMRLEVVKAIVDVDLHLRSTEALFSELSGGQRQGVAIAGAMHFKSKIMILVEPTNQSVSCEVSRRRGLPPFSLATTCGTCSILATASWRWRAGQSSSTGRLHRTRSRKEQNCFGPTRTGGAPQ